MTLTGRQPAMPFKLCFSHRHNVQTTVRFTEFKTTFFQDYPGWFKIILRGSRSLKCKYACHSSRLPKARSSGRGPRRCIPRAASLHKHGPCFTTSFPSHSPLHTFA